MTDNDKEEKTREYFEQLLFGDILDKFEKMMKEEKESLDLHFPVPYRALKKSLSHVPDALWLKLKDKALDYRMQQFKKYSEQLRSDCKKYPDMQATVCMLVIVMDQVMDVFIVQRAIIEELKELADQPNKSTVGKVQGNIPKPVEGWKVGKRRADGMIPYTYEKSGELWFWNTKEGRWIPPNNPPDSNPITPEGKRLGGEGTM